MPIKRALVIGVRCIVFLAILLEISIAQSRGLQPELNTQEAAGTTYALIIGISKYEYLDNLLYADDDAVLFYQELFNRLQGSLKVSLLVDQTATRAAICAALYEIKGLAKEGDNIIVYFAGHGDVENEFESGYLLAYDTYKTNYAATAVSIATIEQFIDFFARKEITTTLIIDACRSGNLSGGISGSASTISAIESRFKHTQKLLSCQPNQLSLEKAYSGGGHGVFTYYLSKGLNGEADRNNDGGITLREMDLYLENVGLNTSNQQNPRVQGDPNSTIFYKNLNKINFQNEKEPITKLEYSGNYRFINYNDIAISKDTLFVKFQKEILENNLVSDKSHSAYEIYKHAIRQKISGEVILAMGILLTEKLDDESNKWISRAIIDEISPNSMSEITIVLKSILYLETIKKLIQEDDFRLNEWEAKIKYYKGILAFLRYNIKEMKEAIPGLIEAGKVLKNQSWLHNCLGLLYYYTNQHQEAIKEFKRCLLLTPKWPSVWNNIGLAQSDYESIISYKQAITLSYKKRCITLCNIAKGFKEVGNIDSMKYYLNESILADSNYHSSWELMGDNHFENKSYDSAAYFYKKAIRLDTALTSGLVSLIHTFGKLKKRGDADFALKEFENRKNNSAEDFMHISQVYYYNFTDSVISTKYGKLAILQDKLKVEAYSSLADIYFQLGHYDSSLNYIHSAINLGDTSQSTKFLQLKSEYYKNEGNFNTNKLDKFILKYPSSKKGLYFRSLLFEKKGDTSNAILYLKRIVSLDSSDLFINRRLGSIYEDQMNFDLAIKYYKQAHLNDSTDAETITNIAYNYEMLDSIKSAEKYYKKALSIEENNYIANLRLGWIIAGRNEHEAALAYFFNAFKTDTANVDLLLSIAYSYDMIENFSEAKRFYKKSTIVDTSKNLTAMVKLARFFYRHNKKDSLLSTLKTIFLINPNLPEANHILSLHFLDDSSFGLSLEYIDIAIKNDPNNSYYYFSRSRINSAMDKYNEAILDLKKAHERGYNNIDRILSDTFLQKLNAVPEFNFLINKMRKD
jgi:tetratricopeptide (TPR) repeat protein